MKSIALLLLVGATVLQRADGLEKCSCSCRGSSASAIWMGSGEPEAEGFVPDVTGNTIQGPPGKIGPSGPVGPRGFNGDQGLPGPPGKLPTSSELWNLGSWLNPGFSCDDLFQRGLLQSGIYSIKLPTVPTPIPVYCEMNATDSGWTLVARIHENDITGKCTNGDLWSSEVGSATVSESNNWMNLNSFGFPHTPTSSDYKSPAYFALNASNAMVWQVSNNVDYVDMSDQAAFKIYTDNDFLSEYGGNLRSLYNDHYRLKKSNICKGKVLRPVEELLQTLNTNSATTRSAISSYFTYTYEKDNYISDGGSDMFDNGNYIDYKIGESGSFTRLTTYDETYTIENDVVVGTVTSQPFHALMWINNENRNTSTFRLKVTSNFGADGSGSYRTYSGSLAHETLSGYYYAFHIYGASDPSICQVFYYVGDNKDCLLVRPSIYKENWPTVTGEGAPILKATGSPRHVLMGYTLLSRSSGVSISSTEVKAALDTMLPGIFTSQKDSFLINGISRESSELSFSVPVKYLKGSNSAMTSHTPPSVRSLTQPGFLTFRAIGDEGYPYAICPGVKSTNLASSRVCVGGMNSIQNDREACGDFAGWAGTSSDSPSTTSPAGYAKSLNDQRSSILIFVK